MKSRQRYVNSQISNYERQKAGLERSLTHVNKKLQELRAEQAQNLARLAIVEPDTGVVLPFPTPIQEPPEGDIA